jgi:hypothetical protein
VGREGETKVSLGKGGNSGSEDDSKLSSSIVRNANRKESGFVVVDGETSSKLKHFQDMFRLKDRVMRTMKENKRIVCILKNWTRITRNQGVSKRGGNTRMLKEATENISHNNE